MSSLLFNAAPLAQVSQFSWKENDPTTVYVFLGIFVAFILFLVIASQASGRSGGGGYSPENTKRIGRFSKGAFRRRARGLGLSRYQIRTLEILYRQFRIPNPMVLLTSSKQMDVLLKRAIMSLEALNSSEAVKESQKLTLFRIKQIIERNSQKKTIYSGTSQLKSGLTIALTPEGGGRYQSRIISVLRDSLALSIPYTGAGKEMRWKRGTKLKVFFWKPNGQGYSFYTKVSGYSSIRGIPSVLTSHSHAIVQAQQRRFRRKNIDRPAYFYPVRILSEGVGKSAQKKAFVDSGRHTLSTIIDVSGGGCSIRTAHPLGENELIKVEFETDQGSLVSFFGKVKHMRRVRPYGGIMHIMFTRISKRNLNRINSFVYDITS